MTEITAATAADLAARIAAREVSSEEVTRAHLDRIAEVDGDQARPDQTELEAVAWLSRDQARAVLAASHPDYVAPPPSAIAHRLIRAWVEGFEADEFAHPCVADLSQIRGGSTSDGRGDLVVG